MKFYFKKSLTLASPVVLPLSPIGGFWFSLECWSENLVVILPCRVCTSNLFDPTEALTKQPDIWVDIFHPYKCRTSSKNPKYLERQFEQKRLDFLRIHHKIHQHNADVRQSFLLKVFSFSVVRLPNITLDAVHQQEQNHTSGNWLYFPLCLRFDRNLEFR